MFEYFVLETVYYSRRVFQGNLVDWEPVYTHLLAPHPLDIAQFFPDALRPERPPMRRMNALEQLMATIPPSSA